MHDLFVDFKSVSKPGIVKVWKTQGNLCERRLGCSSPCPIVLSVFFAFIAIKLQQSVLRKGPLLTVLKTTRQMLPCDDALFGSADLEWIQGATLKTVIVFSTIIGHG